MKLLVAYIGTTVAALGIGYQFGRHHPVPPSAHPFPENRTHDGIPGSRAITQTTVETLAARIARDCREGSWQTARQAEDIINSLAPADIARLVAAAQDCLVDPRQAVLRRVLLARWADGDPATALAWMHLLPEGREKDDLANTIIARWASRNPYEAGRHALALPSGPAQASALAQVTAAWPLEDVQHAISWLAAMPQPRIT